MKTKFNYSHYNLIITQFYEYERKKDEFNFL
jgi:hypothetical protein